MYGVIYKITNLINNKIYIGQTIGTIKKRFREHSCITSNSIISRAIRKYGKENFKIKIIIKCNSLEEMNYREKYCIKLFNSLSPNGYNLREGGNNSRPCKEVIERIANKNRGRKATLETRMRLSKAHIGYVMPNNQKDKISKANTGKKRSEAHRNKYSKCKDSIKIKIICNQNNTIYESIQEASKALNLHPSNLGQHLLGRLKRVEKYTFSKIDKEGNIIPTLFIEKINKHTKKKKPIKCNENGKNYNSITDAAKDLGLKSPGKIVEVINGKFKQYKGYTFSFIEGVK